MSFYITPAYGNWWHFGGVVRSVSQLCRGLAALGHDVTVFTTDSGGDRRMEVPVNQSVEVGGKVIYFKSEFNLKFAYSSALRAACFLNLINFDIMHIASIWNYPGIPAGVAGKRQRIPYVVSTRGSFVPYAMAEKNLRKRIYFKLFAERNLKNASGHPLHC